MITIKLPINMEQKDKKRILKYQKQYSNLLHVYFNRYKEGLSQTNCKHLILNNVELLDSWFRQSCIYQAMALVKSLDNKLDQFNQKMNIKNKLINKKDKTWKEKRQLKKLLKLKRPTPIFGGKYNFYKRSVNSISKQQFNLNRLNPIYSIGEHHNNIGGNRKFYIESTSKVIFKPNKKQKIELKFQCNSKKYRKYLELLIEHKLLDDISITYKLSNEYIWISFDESILKNEYKQFKHIQNRIISIDMNPNYIGYSIIDWINSQKFNIIDKGILSIKNINEYDKPKKKYIKNKRIYEVLHCSKFLIEKMKHYRCNIFSIQDLNIKSSDKERGKRFNRLVNNNWNRDKLVNNLQKWCNIFNVQLINVKPNYSSFIGNIVYRYLRLPDMILSSIQISRRGYQYYHQYILKDKEIKKNIIYIELTERIKKLICQSLEELSINIQKWSSLFNLYNLLKKSKCKYRFPLKNLEFFQSHSLKFQLIL